MCLFLRVRKGLAVLPAHELCIMSFTGNVEVRSGFPSHASKQGKRTEVVAFLLYMNAQHLSHFGVYPGAKYTGTLLATSDPAASKKGLRTR